MDIQDNINILNAEIEKLSVEKITTSTAQLLNTFHGAKMALEELTQPLTKKVQDDIMSGENETPLITNEFFFTHTIRDLKKMCIEIQELCLSVYATLNNEEEKSIYYEMINNLKK
jgi:hypothetical protein